MRLLLLITIFMITQSCYKQKKYRITDNLGNVYTTNEVKKGETGCIFFWDNSRIGSRRGAPVKLCDRWRIKDLD